MCPPGRQRDMDKWRQEGTASRNKTSAAIDDVLHAWTFKVAPQLVVENCLPCDIDYQFIFNPRASADIRCHRPTVDIDGDIDSSSFWEHERFVFGLGWGHNDGFLLPEDPSHRLWAHSGDDARTAGDSPSERDLEDTLVKSGMKGACWQVDHELGDAQGWQYEFDFSWFDLDGRPVMRGFSPTTFVRRRLHVLVQDDAEHEDHACEVWWQHERWMPLQGWGRHYLPSDECDHIKRWRRGSRNVHCDRICRDYAKHAAAVGEPRAIREEWMVAHHWEEKIDECDDEGWQYAVDFPSFGNLPASGKKHAHHFVRRRCWVLAAEGDDGPRLSETSMRALEDAKSLGKCAGAAAFALRQNERDGARTPHIASGDQEEVLGCSFSGPAYIRIRFSSPANPKAKPGASGESGESSTDDDGDDDESSEDERWSACHQIPLHMHPAIFNNGDKEGYELLVHSSDEGHALKVRISREWDVTTGVPRIRIFCPLIISNRSGLPLEYKLHDPFHADGAACTSDALMQSCCPDAKDLSVVVGHSLSEGASICIRVAEPDFGAGETKKLISRAISNVGVVINEKKMVVHPDQVFAVLPNSDTNPMLFSRPGVTKLVSEADEEAGYFYDMPLEIIMPYENGGKCCMLGAYLTQCPAPFERSRMLVIQPRLVVYNNTLGQLGVGLIRQSVTGTKAEAPLTIGPSLNMDHATPIYVFPDPREEVRPDTHHLKKCALVMRAADHLVLSSSDDDDEETEHFEHSRIGSWSLQCKLDLDDEGDGTSFAHISHSSEDRPGHACLSGELELLRTVCQQPYGEYATSHVDVFSCTSTAPCTIENRSLVHTIIFRLRWWPKDAFYILLPGREYSFCWADEHELHTCSVVAIGAAEARKLGWTKASDIDLDWFQHNKTRFVLDTPTVFTKGLALTPAPREHRGKHTPVQVHQPGLTTANTLRHARKKSDFLIKGLAATVGVVSATNELSAEVYLEAHTTVLSFGGAPKRHVSAIRNQEVCKVSDHSSTVVLLRGVSLSLVSDEPKDILRVTLSEFYYAESPSKLMVRLHHLQVDDLTPDSSHPIVLGPAESGFYSARSEKWTGEDVPVILISEEREQRMNHRSRKEDANGVDQHPMYNVVPHLTLDIQSLKVHVDLNHILELVATTTVFYTPGAQSREDGVEALRWLLTKAEERVSFLVPCPVLVKEIAMRQLHVCITADTKFREGQEGGLNELVGDMLAKIVATTLKSILGKELPIGPWHQKMVTFDDSPVLSGEVFMKMIERISILKIVGSLMTPQALSSSFNGLHNFGGSLMEGRPDKAVMNLTQVLVGDVLLGTGVAVTEFVGDMALSFGMVANHDDDAAEKPTTVIQGVQQGLTIAGKTTREGLANLFVMPYREGIKKRSVIGLLAGLTKGAVSATLAPVAGAVILVRTTAEGFKAQAEAFETLRGAVDVVYPPRSYDFSYGVLRDIREIPSLCAFSVKGLHGQLRTPPAQYDHYQLQARQAVFLSLLEGTEVRCCGMGLRRGDSQAWDTVITGVDSSLPGIASEAPGRVTWIEKAPPHVCAEDDPRTQPAEFMVPAATLLQRICFEVVRRTGRHVEVLGRAELSINELMSHFPLEDVESFTFSPFSKSYHERLVEDEIHKHTKLPTEPVAHETLRTKIEWLPLPHAHNELLDGFDAGLDLQMSLYASGRR